MKKGFTLTEALIYVGTLALIILAVGIFFLWTIKSSTKSKVMTETLDNARRAMEIITHEIKEAKGVYTPTSIFDQHPGQLSLEVTKYLPTGETSSYIDFYFCDNHLCLKKEGQPPLALTSNRVKVKNLVFSRIVNATSTSIQVDLTLIYNAPSPKPEYQSTTTLRSSATLRYQ